MKFTVVWVRDAEVDLARFWVDVDSRLRRAIQSAADAIDQALSKAPQLVGESRSGNRRVLYMPPLIVDFEFIVDDRIARVLAVRLDSSFSSSNGRPS